MIKLEHTEVFGFVGAIRGARNPMNSWAKSDSKWDGSKFIMGENDLGLCKRLCKAGSDHRKFMRQIFVSVDITAPLYWWKEFDTYKVGTVANSCSTMHKIHAKEFTLDDFSCEHLWGDSHERDVDEPIGVMNIVIDTLNYYREVFLETKEKSHWWQMIQLLPSSYNQKRTCTFNYEVLMNMYHARKNHKLDEWHDFCHWVEKLPYSDLITSVTVSQLSQ